MSTSRRPMTRWSAMTAAGRRASSGWPTQLRPQPSQKVAIVTSPELHHGSSNPPPSAAAVILYHSILFVFSFASAAPWKMGWEVSGMTTELMCLFVCLSVCVCPQHCTASTRRRFMGPRCWNHKIYKLQNQSMYTLEENNAVVVLVCFIDQILF